MNIQDILKQLPTEYKKACWETKAMSRRRGIQNEDILLLLCLYYAYDKSLIDTKNYAKSVLSIDISDVGFMKRFSRCNDWIKWINQRLLQERSAQFDIPEKLKEMHVLAIDASDIVSKGAIRQTWRLHYAFDLFSMSSTQFQITPESTGETLKNFELAKNDLVLADRAYATITGMEHCMNADADFVMRVRSKAFKMYNADGNIIQLTDLLRTVTEAPTDFFVYYKCPDQSLHSVRLCAVQKSDEEQAYAQKKLRRKESKRQMKISEDTKYSHNYFFVVTSLDQRFSAEDIMTIYRLRWQVEMVFKRLKSVIGLGSMPTKTAESSEAWLNCKMLIALLIEKMLSSVDFPPCKDCSQHVERDEDLIPFDFSLLFKCQ